MPRSNNYLVMRGDWVKMTKVCFTDSDLKDLIKETNCTMIMLEDRKDREDLISRAMSMTTLHVGEALLHQEGLNSQHSSANISKRTGPHCKMATLPHHLTAPKLCVEMWNASLPVKWGYPNKCLIMHHQGQ